MTEWKQYRRTNIAEMRAFVPGEDTSKFSVSEPDRQLCVNDIDEFQRGFVARNPQNHAEQWYVARAYFDVNFEPVA